MKIRNKLLIAFGLYMVLALIPSIFSYCELNTFRKRLKPIEAAGDITNSVLDVRKNEKSLLLLKDQDSLQLLRKQISILKGSIDDNEPDIIREIGPRNSSALREAISSYEANVQSLADNFKTQQDNIDHLTHLGREIENEMSDGDRRQTLAAMRRHERGLITFRDAVSLGALKQALASLRPSSSQKLLKYASLADELYRLSGEERVLGEGLRKTATDIQAYTDGILQRERETLDSRLRTSMNVLLLLLAAVIIGGALINARLATVIAAPIRQIRRFAESVASGDLSQILEIKGSQEFASLAEALTCMTDRLKDTVSSLELAIANLHDKQGQLVEAEKLASLGRIAAGVAHEINNPLAIINEKAGLMQDLLHLAPDFEQKDNFLTQIKGINGSIDRCRSITHRLLGFSRRMEVTVGPMDLNEAIRETITFLKSDIFTKSAQLVLNLAEDLPEIRSDKIQLEQVFLNLIKNAVDAVAEHGEITVTTSRKGELFAQVSISDNGPGIPKDMLRQIFEPFFTTKQRGKGTGLGLFVSHAILRKLRCKIQAQSELGKGTTFILEIPMKFPDAEETVI